MMTSLPLLQRRRVLTGAAAALFLARPAQSASALVAVGTRCGTAELGFSDGRARWMVTGTYHVMPEAADDLQLVFSNFAGLREEPGPNPIRVSVALEYPLGTLVDMQFDGRSSALIAGGETASTDPLKLRLPSGAQYGIRTTVLAEAAPNRWPQTRLISTRVGDYNWFGSDLSSIPKGLRPGNRITLRKGYGPSLILGRRERPGPSVALIGDSLTAGGTPDDARGDRGYAEQALGAKLAWANMGIPGAGLTEFTEYSARRRALISGHFTHALCALGIAEVRGGNDVRIKQHFLDVWNMLADSGMKVWQTTITTHTHSTDGWTTAAGQTVAYPSFARGGAYHRINDWIRSRPAPLAGVFDPAALLVDDSGLWRVPDGNPLTRDGAHLDPFGTELASRAIDPAKFTS